MLECENISGFFFVKHVSHGYKFNAWMKSPCWQTLSFACSILTFSRKILQESSKIFIEHALTAWLRAGLTVILIFFMVQWAQL